MAKTEIERKFLVNGDAFMREAVGSHRLVQGYICRESGRTVRVRIADDKAYLTIKGRSSDNGMSRMEWEMEIPVDDAHELMTLCQGGIIDKTRYIVPASAAGNVPELSVYGSGDANLEPGLCSDTSDCHRGASLPKDECPACGGPVKNQPKSDRKWEVDVFHGDNEGLVMAEIELGSEEEAFDRPSWLGKEVTGDRRYYNSMLSAHPYKTW